MYLHWLLTRDRRSAVVEGNLPPEPAPLLVHVKDLEGSLGRSRGSEHCHLDLALVLAVLVDGLDEVHARLDPLGVHDVDGGEVFGVGHLDVRQGGLVHALERPGDLGRRLALDLDVLQLEGLADPAPDLVPVDVVAANDGPD